MHENLWRHVIRHAHTCYIDAEIRDMKIPALNWSISHPVAPEQGLSAGEGLEYSGHAQVAYEHGVLRALAQLGQSGQQVADAALSGLHSAILMPLLAGIVAAFGMSPMSLPQEDLSHMLRLFSAVYEGRLS